METVNKTTRAGKNGKVIYCPQCSAANQVYHFGWSATECQQCHKTIDKELWLLEGTNRNLPFSFRMDDDIELIIRDIAKKEQRSISQVINLKLREVLKLPAQKK